MYLCCVFFIFKQKTAYELRISDWSSACALPIYMLFEEVDEGEIVVTGDGTACVTVFQAAQIKSGQRLYTNSGCASMGYDLPAAIGAWFASGDRKSVV